MPSDPRVRYAVTTPYTRTDGSIFWLRIGLAYKNTDGTIDAYCDALPGGLRFRLCELPENERARVEVTGGPS